MFTALAFFGGITKYDVWIGLLLVLIAYMVTRVHVAPTVSSIQDLVTILNTKGGIILTLGLLSLTFFFVTIGMFYIIIQDLKAKTLTVDNAVALMALQFCMNSAFSLCLGAMLKTMTGEVPVDKANTNITETTSKVISPKQEGAAVTNVTSTMLVNSSEPTP